MSRTNPVLYIMKQEPDGPFKIGVSTNPNTRLSTVQTGNPREVSLVETIHPGEFCARTIESKAMGILKPHHVRGKWYNASLDVIQNAMYQAKSSADQRFVVEISKKQATPVWANTEKITEILVEARRISSMSGFNFQVDYIVPLSHSDVCGLHVEHNMRIVSKAHKGQYYQEDWNQKQVTHDDPKIVIQGLKNSTTRYDAHVARDPALTKWVMAQTKEYALLPFKQRIHVALTGDNPVCKYGKQRGFRSSSFGWCGLDYCRCKREA